MLFCLVSDTLADENPLERDHGAIASGHRRRCRVDYLRRDEGFGFPSAFAPAGGCGRRPGILVGATGQLANATATTAGYCCNSGLRSVSDRRNIADRWRRTINLFGNAEILEGAPCLRRAKLEPVG